MSCGATFAGSGGRSAVVECCTKSGALYVFDRQELATLPADAAAAPDGAGRPAEPDGFVRAAAADWLGPGHPVLPIVRRAFGDAAAGG